MDCPKCKLTCPPDTVRCECGHIFKSEPVAYNNSHYKNPVEASPIQEVTVKGINMSFWNMVVFMVKWTLAAIPAMIIISVIYFVIAAVVSGGLAGVISLIEK